MIVKKKVHCTTSISQSELNYPSFSIPKKTSAQTYTRTVTNVGEAISTYTVKVSGLKDVEVTVNPKILKFTELNQKASYKVTVKSLDLTGHSQGFIIWSSDRYSVRSPIYLFTVSLIDFICYMKDWISNLAARYAARKLSQ